MYCWNCGTEVDDSARFCSNCGAELKPAAGAAAGQAVDPAPAPQPVPAPAPAPAQGTIPVPEPAQTAGPAVSGEYPAGSAGTYGQASAAGAPPARKKSRRGLVFLAIIAVLLIFAAISGNSRRKQGGTDPAPANISTAAAETEAITMPAVFDLVKLHEVYLSEDAGDGVRIYAVVFYTAQSHTLTDVFVEFICDKGYDFTLEGVQSVNLEEDYPAFAEMSYDEDEDYVKFICKMKDLKDTDNIQAMVDAGVLEMEDEGPVGEIDADYYMQSFLDDGWVLAPAEDYQLLDLDLD